MFYVDNSEKKIKYYIDNFAIKYCTAENVNGFGYGFKSINGYNTEIPSLTFLVEKKLSPYELSPKALIPKSIGSITTDVIEVGKFSTTPSYSPSPYAPTEKTERLDKYWPAFGGLSCSHIDGTDDFEGCITAAVTDKKAKRLLYFLSCNHVLTRDFKGHLKDKIVHPASIYRNSTQIGLLEFTASITPRSDPSAPEPLSSEYNFVDAALAYVGVDDPNRISRKIFLAPGISEDRTPIDGTIAPKIGDAVWKVGPYPVLTKTTGKITLTNVTLKSIKLRDKFFAFKDQNIASIPFTRGDSGALLMKKRAITSKNDAVGMCIGAYVNPEDKDKGPFTIFTSINTVLDKVRAEFI